MTTITTLDMLSANGVSIKTQQHTEVDGVEYAIGQPHRCAYANSERGRERLSTALSDGGIAQEDYDAIIAKWGDAATVTEGE